MSSSKSAKHETVSSSSSSPVGESDTELNLLVEEMIDQMENRFQLMGNTIMKRMEEMSVRMGELEQSIANIMEQAGGSGVESSTTPSSSSFAATAAGAKDNNNNNNGNASGGTINSSKPPKLMTMEI